MLKVNPNTARNAIKSLIDEIPSLMIVGENSCAYGTWIANMESTLVNIYGDWKNDPTVKAIHKLLHPVFPPTSTYPVDPRVMHQNQLNNIKAKLEGLLKSLELLSDNDNKENSNVLNKDVESSKNEENNLIGILKNFHRFALQLINRQNNRPPVLIKDEYDVQDLIHAILLLKYDDVRNEEPIPSRSGAGSRIDFLLKKEQIGLEVKMTRKSLGDERLGQEILTDIDRYSAHQDCKRLIFFIYDPEHFIKKPTGFINDIESKYHNVNVIISPLL